MLFNIFTSLAQRRFRRATRTDSQPAGACWVCGGLVGPPPPALRKSDLVSEYGRSPYQGDLTMMHLVEGDIMAEALEARDLRLAQSPEALAPKRRSTLCFDCNTRALSPYDEAHRRFLRGLAEPLDGATRQTGTLDLRKIFGPRVRAEVPSLVRYYCASFGCQLHHVGQPVPVAVIEAVRGGPLPWALAVSFCDSRPEDCVEGGYFGGRTSVIGAPAPWPHTVYQHEESARWLRVVMRYAQPPHALDGSALQPKSDVLRVGPAIPM